LEEVNLSGDSWVTSLSLVGLSKHPYLKILHLGHYDHGDTNCDENLQEYPPKGMFIEGIFKNKAAFPRLHLLFLE
jgi:F-box/leucine-rich repeat protein 2/20